MNRIIRYLSIITLFLVFGVEGIAQTVQPDAQGIIYVRKGYQGDGSAWNNALGELADALKWANENESRWTEASPLKIYVAKGTYKPRYTPEDGKAFSADAQYARDRTFLLVNNVQLYGGFAGTETALTDRDLSITNNATILSGDIGIPNDKTDNAYHVVMSINAVGVACLNGFSITDGYASSTGNISVNSHRVVQAYGGGMYNVSSSPTLTHVAIYNNTVSSSSSFGGGMYNQSSSPTLTHVEIYNNTVSSSSTSSRGGGMYNSNSSPALTNVTIYNNTACASIDIAYGGGMYNSNSSPALTNVTIYNNTASASSAYGGGMYNSNSSPALTNVTIYNNTASASSAYGGGMYNSNSSPTLIHVAIYNNTASSSSSSSRGGGMYNNNYSRPILTNVTIYNNTASSASSYSFGGGMFNSESSPTLTNVTVAQNQAKGNSAPNSRGGGIFNTVSSSSSKIYNSIIWGNMGFDDAEDNIGNLSGSRPQFYHSLIQGSGGSTQWDDDFGTDGAGNIDADPLFTDATNGDYSLQNNSPAIDAGNNSYYTDADKGNGNLTTDKDLAGNPRLVGSIIDMGAYEYQSVQITPDANNVLYVNKEVVGGNNSGNSWTNAITELADALQWANENKSRWTEEVPLRIFVAAGIYNPKFRSISIDNDGKLATDRDNTFLMVPNVQLYGSFDPEAGITELTHQRLLPTRVEEGIALGSILNGKVGNINDITANVYHVVLSVGDVETALIDGFTITSGMADGKSSIMINGYSMVPQNNGGGMLNMNSSPAISNCLFTGNSASMYGGGVYNSYASPKISDSRFIRNEAGVFGGGVYNDGFESSISRSTFSNNTTGQYGGGIYSYQSTLRVDSCSFINNTAVDYGGGAMASFSSPSSVLASRFVGNMSGYDGGALYNTDSRIIISGSLLADNITEEGNGGAFYNAGGAPILVNTTVANNKAVEGAGLYIQDAADPKVYNSIISRNRSLRGAIDNVVYQGNKPLFKHSLVEGEVARGWKTDWGVDGGGNVISAVDPFDGSAAGNYKMASGSPAINRGDKELFWEMMQLLEGLSHAGTAPEDDSNLWGNDLAGGKRIVGGTIDLGAYEYQCTVDAPTGLAEQSFCAGADKTITDLLVVGENIRWYRNQVGGDALLATELLVDGMYYASQMLEGCESGERFAVKVKMSEITPPIVQDLVYIYGDHAIPLAGEVALGAKLMWYTVELGGTGSTVAPMPATDVVGEQFYWVSQVSQEGCESHRVGIKVTVEPALLTVTAKEGQSKSYMEDDPIFDYMVDGFKFNDSDNQRDILKGALDRVKGEVVGKYEITQGSLDTVGNNYTLKFVSTHFEIVKAALPVFIFDDASFVYDGSSRSLAVVGLPNGAQVTYVGNRQTEAGKYRVTAIIDGGNNYNGATATATLTIDKALLPTFTFDDGSFVYDGAYKALAVVGLPSGAQVTYLGNGQTEAGKYRVTAIIDGGKNYNGATATATLTIDKARLPTFTFDDGSFVYDGTSRALVATGLPAGAQVTYVGNGQTEAGKYRVTAIIDGGKNYNGATATATLTIDKALLPAFTFDDGSFVYDGTPKALVATGLPTGATVSSYVNNGQTNAGEYTVTAKVAGGTNYSDGSQTAKLTIAKAVLPAFAFADATFTYDGTSKALVATGLPAGATVSSYVNNGQTNAGEYTVTAKVAGGTNYSDGSQTAKLTIAKAVLPAFAFADATFTYDGTSKALVATGLPAGATVSSYVNNGQTNAGEYTVTAKVAGGTNYSDGSQTAKLTIGKAALPAFAFADATFTYDGTPKSVVATGLPIGVTANYTNNDQTNAGEYTVTAEVAGGTNYLDGSQTAKLTIGKAKQTIKFNAPDVLSRDAGTVALDVSSSSGLPLTLTVDDPSVATVSGTDLNVLRLGTVQVTARQAGDHNHEAAAPVTVSIRVKDNKSELPVVLNKALSPNGDGINDFLRIEGIQDYPENKVTIFDRNGSVLAEIEGYNNGDRVFTGKDSRDGTYYYYLDVKDNGVWKREKGYFVIKR